MTIYAVENTGEVKEYRSGLAAARHYGICYKTVYYDLKRTPRTFYPGYFNVKFFDAEQKAQSFAHSIRTLIEQHSYGRQE